MCETGLGDSRLPSGLRIGIDASNLKRGGGVTHLRELLNALGGLSTEFGGAVVWAGRATIEQLPEGLAWLGKVHVAELDGPIARRLLWRRTGLPRLAEGSCDILFIPGGLPNPTRLPSVNMSRNMLPFESGERQRYGFSYTRLRLEILRRLQLMAFRQADGLIFLSRHAKEAIEPLLHGGPKRVAIIPHGVDSRFMRLPSTRTDRHESWTLDQPCRILYVSTVSPYKHQWNVVEAVRQLRDERFPVRLDLVGGAHPPSLRRLERILQRVDPDGMYTAYRGLQPFGSIDRVYRDADVFVFASTCENLPNILIEAMASGLPIACSDREPMPEVLEDAGVYIDPENPEDIASGLRTILTEHDLRREIASRAHRRARDYTWPRCAQETMALLREVHSDAVSYERP